MAKTRKQITINATVPKLIPKKRQSEKPQVEIKEKPEVINKEEKKKKADFKTIRIAMNADIEERKQISERIQKGELSFAYFAVDGDNSYHYYFVK
jgi:microcompartment protein CcmL/EutN